VSPSCRAASRVTTVAVVGNERAISTTVRATDVTAVPFE
jgi:hypothetical protein